MRTYILPLVMLVTLLYIAYSGIENQKTAFISGCANGVVNTYCRMKGGCAVEEVNAIGQEISIYCQQLHKTHLERWGSYELFEKPQN